MNENYYDIKELSGMFGLSEHTIRKYCNMGKINAIKIGRTWTAKESDIKEYLLSTRQKRTRKDISKHQTPPKNQTKKAVTKQAK